MLDKEKFHISGNIKMIIITLLITLTALLSCHTSTEPPIIEEEKRWELIPEFADMDVRYIIKNKNTLFLGAVNIHDRFKGILYKTHDCINWEVIGRFPVPVGPLAFHGDTLYILSDSLYKYTPSNQLKGVCRYGGLINSDPGSYGDMIFYKDTLYLMQSVFLSYLETTKLKMDGTYENLKVILNISFGGAKFILNPSDPNGFVYVRPNYFCPNFYYFDGEKFYFLTDGLTSEETKNSPLNSMAFKDNTLYAGFRNPASIKILKGNTWVSYTDSLPRSKYADNFKPALKTETTAIVFYKERMFVATKHVGVQEWKGDSGWVSVSNGLVEVNNFEGLYDPVVFLETFNDLLIAAYGTPGFGQYGGNGVYKYKLKQ